MHRYMHTYVVTYIHIHIRIHNVFIRITRCCIVLYVCTYEYVYYFFAFFTLLVIILCCHHFRLIGSPRSSMLNCSSRDMCVNRIPSIMLPFSTLLNILIIPGTVCLVTLHMLVDICSTFNSCNSFMLPYNACCAHFQFNLLQNLWSFSKPLIMTIVMMTS